MELHIPINRTHVVQLLRAAWAALRGYTTTLKFTGDEMTMPGEGKPVMFSEDELRELELKHAGYLLKIEALTGLLRDALEVLPDTTRTAEEIRQALEGADKPRVLH